MTEEFAKLTVEKVAPSTSEEEKAALQQRHAEMYGKYQKLKGDSFGEWEEKTNEIKKLKEEVRKPNLSSLK